MRRHAVLVLAAVFGALAVSSSAEASSLRLCGPSYELGRNYIVQIRARTESCRGARGLYAAWKRRLQAGRVPENVTGARPYGTPGAPYRLGAYAAASSPKASPAANTRSAVTPATTGPCKSSAPEGSLPRVAGPRDGSAAARSRRRLQVVVGGPVATARGGRRPPTVAFLIAPVFRPRLVALPGASWRLRAVAPVTLKLQVLGTRVHPLASSLGESR